MKKSNNYIDVCDILVKIQGKIINSGYSISGEEETHNIKKIKEICDAKYSNQYFYGNSALNRKILLDGDIAELLTVETLIALICLRGNHESTTLYRTGGSVTILSAIYNGFKDGLKVIECLPNNEKNYGIEQYKLQKKLFQENTQKIVNNIIIAANKFDITINEESSDFTEEKTFSLEQLFSQINMASDILKKQHRDYLIIDVPGYSSLEIQRQSLNGFRKLCQLAKVNVEDGYIILERIENFIDKLISAPQCFLDGEVSHLFYDRVHLEACMIEKTVIQMGGVHYYLSDIINYLLQGIARNIQKNPDDELLGIIGEQWYLRLFLVRQDIQMRFPETLILQNLPLIKQPYNYLTPLKFLEKQGLEIKGNKSLKELDQAILSFIKKQIPEEEKIKIAFGCSFKNYATVRLEHLLNEFCRLKNASLMTEESGELTLWINDLPYRIELILAEADFSMIHLTSQQAEFYIELCKIMVPDQYNFSEYRNFDENDEGNDGSEALIHRAGVIALRVYAKDNYYQLMQRILRLSSIKQTSGLTHEYQRFIFLLLTIAFSTRLLSKTSTNVQTEQKAREEVLYRVDYHSGKEVPAFIQERINLLKEEKHVLAQKNFTSVSFGFEGFCSFLKNQTPLQLLDISKTTLFITLLIQPASQRTAWSILNLLDKHSGHFVDEHEGVAPPGTAIIYKNYFEDKETKNGVFIAEFCRSFSDEFKYSEEFEKNNYKEKIFQRSFKELNNHSFLNSNPYSLILKALKTGGIDLIKVILKQNPQISKKTGENNNNLLHLAAAHNCKPAIIELLCESKVEILAKNHLGETPAHIAARHRNRNIIDILQRFDQECLKVKDDQDKTVESILYQQQCQLEEASHLFSGESFLANFTRLSFSDPF